MERLDAPTARREFVANASHELRTPLFSLGGFLELLDDEDIDDDTRAASCAEVMTRLTKLADLLDLSRLTPTRSRSNRPVDLAVTARGARARGWRRARQPRPLVRTTGEVRAIGTSSGAAIGRVLWTTRSAQSTASGAGGGDAVDGWCGSR
jgi:signal transduction histidine kinase